MHFIWLLLWQQQMSTLTETTDMKNILASSHVDKRQKGSQTYPGMTYNMGR